MTETETIETNKPWYKRVIACFCAFLISCLVCFCGFAIPKVHAESIADQFEEWLDNASFEGASYVFEEVLDSTAGTAIGAPYYGVMFALNVIEADSYASGVPLNAITSCDGYYTYQNKKWYACSSIPSGQYFPSDGNINVIQSANYSVDYHFSFTNYPADISVYDGNYNGFYTPTVRFRWGGGYQDYSIDVHANSSIWADFSRSYNSDYSLFSRPFGVAISKSIIPDLSDGLESSQYLALTGQPSSNYSCVAGGGHGNINLGDSLDDFGIDPNTVITPENKFDFVLDTLNPVVIENYPQLIQYIFIPQEAPTETTSPGGCGCHVDVYVDVEPTIIVEPTINVYINPWELPSDEQDYTFPTTPAHETIPFPTQDSSNTEPVTMPTMDLEEFQQTYKNAFDFWFYCAEQLIEKMNLQILLAFVFVVTVVGFIMWKLGG